jgi:hypothetical protein
VCRAHYSTWEAQCLTGGALSAQVFGEKEFNLVVMPIHPPLGDIKLLLTGVASYPSSEAEFRPRVARPIVWWVVGLFCMRV